MGRLTTDKSVQEMGMVELAYNCCIAKDGKAVYRDFDGEVDAREFARILYKSYTSEELSKDDDVFDDEMLENLQYKPEDLEEGLIALFYRNLWAMADLRERLKIYEDAEEQGLLLRLPVAIGDKVYEIIEETVPGHHFYISEYEIQDVSAEAVKYADDWCEYGYPNLYLTREEAEQALKQMGE